METVLILLILAAVFVAIKGCIIVEQQEVVIVQRLGKYKETLGAGLNFIVPFIDSPQRDLPQGKHNLPRRQNLFLYAEEQPA